MVYKDALKTEPDAIRSAPCAATLNWCCNDVILGNDCCGSTCGDLNNANARFVRNKYGHIGIISSTLQLQYNILSKHAGQEGSSDYYTEGAATPPYCPTT
ncbi:unnamed protein product [Toxocara canis]|uniref:Disintegrin domain-containing protein n=1 Tax=Toxocara canis TaxID=6265 RepID=A0A183VGX8_TOXCA|nr:unnamed protein product [Toxocara canis]